MTREKGLFSGNFGRLFWLIIIGGLLARVLLIDRIPTSFTHDEMFYAVEGKSVATDGWDLKGLIVPWLSFTPSHGAFSELSGSVLAPGFWFFANPVIGARAVPVLLGLLIPILIGMIAWEITKDRRVLLSTIFVAMWNPWIFQFSRSSIDPPIGLFFILLGTWWQIHFEKKKRWWSVLAYSLGFFTYQAYKLVVLPLVLLTTVFTLQQGKRTRLTKPKKIWQLLIPLFFMSLVFGNYVMHLQTQSAAQRTSHILPFDKVLLAGLTDKERRLTLPNPLKDVVSNKVTVFGERFLEQYVEAFSPKKLFVHGEEALSPFSVWSVGMFYLIDAILIGVGMFVLFTKWRRAGFYLLAVVLIAPLPTALNSSSISMTFRSSLILYPLLVFSGLGLAEITRKLPKVTFGVIGLYLLFIAGFLYQYFWRYPLYAADGLFLSDRIVSSYAARLGEKVVVVTNDEPFFLFENYLLFNKKISKDSLIEIRAGLANDKYQLGEVEFRRGCVDTEAIQKGEHVIAAADVSGCKELPVLDDFSPLSVAMVTDSGERYRIYNDNLCKTAEMRAYLFPQKLEVFSIETLGNEDFCKNWITDLNGIKL